MEYARRLSDHSVSLLISNPEVLKMEKAAQSDSDYLVLMYTLKSGHPPKSLPAQSEGWKILESGQSCPCCQRDIVLMEDQVIIVPEGYRQTIFKMFHETSHHCQTMFQTLRRYHMLPSMRKTIQEYTKKCSVCLQFHPSKEGTIPAGLPVNLADLNPNGLGGDRCLLDKGI